MDSDVSDANSTNTLNIGLLSTKGILVLSFLVWLIPRFLM